MPCPAHNGVRGENGLELWRRLHAEWRGSAFEVAMVQQERYQQPVRSKSLATLWDDLDKWVNLGEELAMADYELPDQAKRVALLRLLPEPMVDRIREKPESERTFAAMVSWV